MEMKRLLKKNGTLIIVDWCADYRLVRMYHYLEGLRWNDRRRWGWFTFFAGRGGNDLTLEDERYPGPLTHVNCAASCRHRRHRRRTVMACA
jgi:hypothetical protein